jgi:hypothetical protein
MLKYMDTPDEPGYDIEGYPFCSKKGRSMDPADKPQDDEASEIKQIT